LSDLQKELDQEHNLSFEVHEYTLGQNTNKAKILYTEYKVPNSQQGLVPAIFVGEKYFVGFNVQIGEEIRRYLLEIENGMIDEEKKIVNLPIL